MLLHDLLRRFDSTLSLDSVPNCPINGVQEDSRLIQSGDLFVARHGTKADGAAFLADAKARGAVAAVVVAKMRGCPLPQVVIGDTTLAAAKLAHLFHGDPSRTLRVLGITGTNGKTTTTYLVRHLLRKMNQRCGLIGTVEIDDGKQTWESTLTTPGATELAGLLGSMRDKGCRACTLEASSHALDQGRLAGVNFVGVAFTNLTGDHLDYHKTMEQYAAAKAKLFEGIGPTAVAVVNAEDAWTSRIIRDCPGRVIRFGFGKDADYRARDISVTANGTSFMLITPDGKAQVTMGLIGKHNIENALTAAALVGEVFGATAAQLASGLSDAVGAPGRLQSVRQGQPFAVLVDYAHTDDALENVLSALKPLASGKLRVLFGCGGDRDRTKRPRMARIAQQLADAVYVTSDNPRTEMPLAIITDIVAGFSPSFRAKAIIEPDRRTAIERILGDAEPGDVVLIAGKGHENYQIVGTAKHPFDDVAEAVRALSSKPQAA